METQQDFERALMEGRLDPFDFVLAEKLGMTVEHMLTVMSNREYFMWRAFYRYRSELEKLEYEKAMAEAKAKGGRRGR